MKIIVLKRRNQHVPTIFTSLIVTYNSANEILNLLMTFMPMHLIIKSSLSIMLRTMKLWWCKNTFQGTAGSEFYKRGMPAVNQGFELCNTEYVLPKPDIRSLLQRFSLN
jgi:hypothetical protein